MRILLAEDDELLGSGIRAGLAQNGFQVDWVRDGVAAERELATGAYQAAVLDLGLPRQDGMEVLRQVKATQPDIEVIILTGHGNETDRETCMGLGAFAYLQKPVDIDVLSETMKQANEKIQARKQAQQGA